MPVVANPFSKALTVNSTDVDWALDGGTAITEPLSDVYVAGLGNSTAPQIVLILP